MGTFQTIKFKNETDKLTGLEALVNENFYALFTDYPQDKTILIPENRLFMSAGTEVRGEKLVSGIKGIPDALLIVFNKKNANPFQINLIEYECFGESKVRASDKSNYMNGQIIPQLMKFASSFSIVTDRHIRDQTITAWSEKIITYIFNDITLKNKMIAWIKTIEPAISDHLVGYHINNLLREAFETNLKILLIIDELSSEQKQTITNVIHAFKLPNEQSIQFNAFQVRLEQRINVIDEKAEYA